MDIRVLKIRLENALTNGTEGELFRAQIQQIVDELNNEVEISDRNISAGMIGKTIDELRDYYFSLLDEYGAIPKTISTLVQRGNMLDDLTITLSKMVNYLGFAMSRNASSSDPNVQRVCAVLRPELENFKKEAYTLGQLLQNIITDKKLYLETVKDK